MTNRSKITCINLIVALVAMPPANGGEPPKSAEHLRSSVETALKIKDTNALTALFNWEGVSDEMKPQIPMVISMIFQTQSTNVVIQPVPADFKNAFTRNGITYIFNLPVAGVIAVHYGAAQPQQNAVGGRQLAGGGQLTIPYGKGSDGYYLATQAKKIGDQSDPLHPDKCIWIFATSTGAGNRPDLALDYGYFSGLKEIKSQSAHKGVISLSFPGKSVADCNLRTTATNGTTRLRIKVDGVDVFDSKEVDVEKTKEIHFNAKY
jgi:hypothetical protein